MINSPLDQFRLAPVIKVQLLGLDLSLTNMLLSSMLTLLVVYFLTTAVKDANTQTMFITPLGWQLPIEKFYSLSAGLLVNSNNRSKEKYFQIVVFLLVLIAMNNVVGLTPYCFTITTHITVTFFLSFAIFIAANIIGFERHGIKLVNLFLPAGTGFLLSLLLVPIELISYLSRPVSLGVRLFVNMMAGHSLLKVMAWFSWNILIIGGVKAVFYIIPLAILSVLVGLELGVALIQAYVFVVLTAVYLSDVESFH